MEDTRAAHGDAAVCTAFTVPHSDFVQSRKRRIWSKDFVKGAGGVVCVRPFGMRLPVLFVCAGCGAGRKRTERDKMLDSGDTGTDRQCCAALKPVDEGGLFYQYGELL